MRTPKTSTWSRWAQPLVAVSIVALLVGATLRLTDLSPQVERDFFFSSGSGTLEQAAAIEERFALQSQLVVIARSQGIGAGDYRRRIAGLERELAGLDGVLGSRSLASGPDDLADARESPLWSRLLLAGDGSASHLLLFVADPWPDSLIPSVEAALERHRAEGFELSVAGVPYTVAVMQRKLVRDFSVFSAVAAVGFALAALALFRSLRIAFGVVGSCTAAVAATFLVLQAAGASLGLLSANLVTIVFVLTQSHLVFLTSNWLNEDASRAGALRRAMRRTLRPSLSSAATTLLGFGTLLFVEAKPLRELGLGGVVGGSAALASAYLLYPLFLAGGEPGRRRREPGRIQAWLTRPHPAATLAIVAAALALGIGLARLDTDPSLLDYFDEGGEIHEALAYLDRHTGSAPLQLVVERADGGALLDGEDAYESLWTLQRRLESEPTVGRIVSLPVLLAEADRRPLASILSWEMILRVLESRFAERVANGFVTEDRSQTLFSLQMVDHERETTRVEVVDGLREVVRSAGFEVALVGGVYHLQGTLAALVARSMVESLAALALLFTAVGWITTGSLRVSLAMSAVLALVPVAVFGGLGLARVPIDVVTAPGASIGLGLAADTLLHLAVAARRAEHAFGPEAWAAAIRAQGPAIARASLIVALGFGLFAFSGFPPTRRFGLVVALSMLAAAPLALVVLPRLAGRRAGGGGLARALLPDQG